MTKTLILLFHPDLAHSKANAALAAAAAKLPAVELVDMQAIYPVASIYPKTASARPGGCLNATVSCCSSPSSGTPRLRC